MAKDGNAIPTFHPTLAQLADWEAFVATMEEEGAHRIGIAKLIMPEGWQPRKGGYNLSNLDLKVDKLLIQNIEGAGCFYPRDIPVQAPQQDVGGKVPGLGLVLSTSAARWKLSAAGSEVLGRAL